MTDLDNDAARDQAHARYMASFRRPLQSWDTQRILGRMSEDDAQSLIAWLAHNERSIAEPGLYGDFGILAGVFEAVFERKAAAQ